MILLKILFLLLSYLIGSIPFGLIIGKIKKMDLRQNGSKNIGTANAIRVLGKKVGFVVFLLDALKGALFVFLFRYKIIPLEYMVLSPALYGLLATLGHTFSIYLGFKGGKGVATGAGAIFAYLPLSAPICLISFIIITKISKIASIGSLSCAIITLIISIIFTIIGFDPLTNLTIDIYFLISTIIIVMIIFIRHISNIKRLIKHNENKFI